MEISGVVVEAGLQGKEAKTGECRKMMQGLISDAHVRNGNVVESPLGEVVASELEKASIQRMLKDGPQVAPLERARKMETNGKGNGPTWTLFREGFG